MLRKYFKKTKKQESGITLVALVVTIVVLIILAVISINIVFNDGGMVDRAEKVRHHQANAEAQDKEKLGMLDNTIKEYINGSNNSGYIDSELINSPKLSQGMIPVKWNGTNWVKTTADDSSWYNYANKEWTNIVLEDSTFSGEILDETKPYSQLVWIPRFAYKVTSGWHATETGTIDVVFVGTDNQGKDGTVYNGTYSNATNGITSGGAMKNFVVHPAFDYGDKKLEGIWVGKYQSSHTKCTTDKTTGEVAYTENEIMQIKPNVTSWRMISTGNAFTACLNMNQEANLYGLNTNDNIVDPHLMKNTEWGATAYLSKSKYGKETEEVYINNSSDYIVGNAGDEVSSDLAAGITNSYQTQKGQKASTTGNIYGVYDMSGAAWERTAAYIDNEHENLQKYGVSIINSNMKYRNVYKKGTSDMQELNYQKAVEKYGDAIYETSNDYTGPNKSWYADCTDMVREEVPFFVHGGDFSYMTSAGVFAFGTNRGAEDIYCGFRTVISVL